MFAVPIVDEAAVVVLNVDVAVTANVPCETSDEVAVMLPIVAS